MTLTEVVVKNIITRLIKGKDYRIEVVTLLDATFLQYAIEFFKKVVHAKLNNQIITPDWYKHEFLKSSLSSKEIAINSGLNMKTISNMYNDGTKKKVIEASNEHYDELYKAIQDLVKSDNQIDITLTIKFNNVSVDLTVSESLIVINTLAVKRAELRGGLWSAAGKKVETPLMLTLCKMFDVDSKYYKTKALGGKSDITPAFAREVDFYFVDPLSNEEYKCEVKLMGKGNPESADAVIARGSKVFVADKLSVTNKAQLDSLKVEWVELRNEECFSRFSSVLSHLGIPHNKSLVKLDVKQLDSKLEPILKEIFK